MTSESDHRSVMRRTGERHRSSESDRRSLHGSEAEAEPQLGHQSLQVRSRLLRILACPDCRGPLWSASEGGSFLQCSSCRRAYEVRHGIPLLLGSCSSRAPGKEWQPENERLREWLNGHTWLSRMVEALRPPLPYYKSGRWRAQQRFSCLFDLEDPDMLIINVGGGKRFGENLDAMDRRLLEKIAHLDISPSRQTDVVGDAQRIPAVASSVDGVIMQGVLEHLERPWIVVDEVWRVLKPGGHVYCEVPFIQWYHEDPGDYYRFTTMGVAYLFRQFQIVDQGVSIGPGSALSGVIREVIPSYFGNKYVSWTLRWLLGWVTYPICWLDVVLARGPRAHVVALALYVIARKPM